MGKSSLFTALRDIMGLISSSPPISAIRSASEVVIISNDTGFDAIVDFWVARGVNIRRQGIPPHNTGESGVEGHPTVLSD